MSLIAASSNLFELIISRICSNISCSNALRGVARVTCPRNFPQFDVEFAQPFEGANECERADLAKPRLLG